MERSLQLLKTLFKAIGLKKKKGSEAATLSLNLSKTMLKKLVMMALDQLRQGCGLLLAETVAGTVLVIVYSV